MAAERFYIYRCGQTDSCALTAAKNDARLPDTLCPAGWTFWMQITRHQDENDRYGFAFKPAIAEIKVKGYYPFTGTLHLLGDRVPIPVRQGSSNV